MSDQHGRVQPPDFPASGILVLIEKHGDPECRMRVASSTHAGNPLIKVGQMLFTQDEITTAAEQGWLQLEHDADAGWLWLSPGEKGAAWLDRPGRIRRP